MARKIHIYVDGKYCCTTQKAKTLTDAVAHFCMSPVVARPAGMQRVPLTVKSKVRAYWGK